MAFQVIYHFRTGCRMSIQRFVAPQPQRCRPALLPYKFQRDAARFLFCLANNVALARPPQVCAFGRLAALALTLRQHLLYQIGAAQLELNEASKCPEMGKHLL